MVFHLDLFQADVTCLVELVPASLMPGGTGQAQSYLAVQNPFNTPKIPD